MSEYTDRQQRNMELVRRGFEAYAAGDQEGLVAVFSPDAVLISPPGTGNSGTFHGQDALLQWSRPWLSAWDEFTSEIDELTPYGDHHMVVVVNQTGRGRDGIEVTARNAFAYEVGDDGLCVKMGFFLDPEEARAAVREWGAPE